MKPVRAEDIHVTFKNVSKTYDAHTFVVDNLNLAIRHGEFLTLLGPSGSGKTTSLMMLAGFEQPTSGEIFLGDSEISKLPPQKRGIGMVFQSYALFPHMTVNENLAFPLQARGVDRSKIAEKVSAALDMVRLTTIGSRKPQQLSGGQQQRIALARALIAEPRVVLMDEPLGALDKQLRDHMQLEIRGLHERLGVTIVYVTHDQGEAMTMSDRVAVFHAGKIQQLAPPRDIYDRPANAFVASFIGESNRVPGQVVELDGRHCRVVLIDGTVVGGRPADVSEVGESAVLSIRPERVLLGASSANCDAQLNATCGGTIFHGDHMRIRLVHDVLGEITAKVPSSGLNSVPETGADVKFGWREDDVTVLRHNRQ
ncbi:ABC transporter ATP-binding protein [Mesorhizobium sp.]|uniref:ABC transporter ATP-binding protein n=1 Tax=Mesorhizobium sp. TaxID=1871066 RepID=UPI000FE9F58E|nr:ABC transporter ATP-binding protein [Mesorhizobium sp.]RWB69997.1 MAG: ABC transporter ATP-binding protein [Mesorhizobium sp.]